MSDIRMPGLATGLDTSSIIDQLMSIERRPVNLLQNQQKTQNTSLDRLRLLNTKFLALETAAKAVMGTGSQTSSPFSAKSATSSDNSVFTASATSSATPGTYTVDVVNLATAQKAGGNAYSGPSVNSTLRIAKGGTNVDIALTAGDTVDTVASKINAASSAGLAASVVGGRLVLLGKQTGTAENYTISEVAGSGNLLNELGVQPAGTDVAGADATIKVAGITINSGTNTFTNAVNGVSLTAVSVGAGKTLTVGADQSTGVNAVKEMVAKYNDIIAQIKEDQKYDPATKKAGPLIGDPFVGSLATWMNRMVTEEFATGAQNGGLLNYSDVGLQVQRDGTLTLDEAKLTAKMNSNPNEVYALFSREDNANDGTDPLVTLNQGANAGNMGDGIANRLRAYANSMTSATSTYNFRQPSGARWEGGLMAKINSTQNTISSIGDHIDAYNRRLEMREKNLRAQFVAMERAVAQLRNQGGYLSGQFSQQSSG